jgi:phosphoenolpyruvate carboxylase
MVNDTYRSLLELVRNRISKQTTNMRNSVSAEERLTATLDFTSHKQLFCRYISINSSQNTVSIRSTACGLLEVTILFHQLLLPITKLFQAVFTYSTTEIFDFVYVHIVIV